jgi:hypothetical protein
LLNNGIIDIWNPFRLKNEVDITNDLSREINVADVYVLAVMMPAVKKLAANCLSKTV